MIAVDLKDLVPLALAAQRIGISRERLLRRVIAGKMEGVQVAGRWLVAVATLERLEQQKAA